MLMSECGEFRASIIRNLEIVQDNIARVAMRVGRAPEDIHLLVVTKTHPVEKIQCVIDEGIAHLGENYVEEAREKIMTLQSNKPCFWHMIGHVQSRKSAEVTALFDSLHSLDSVKLAQRLNLSAAEKKKIFPVLLEFNLGGEESKSGWKPGMEHEWKELLPQIEAIINLPNLQVRGLMTMPPFFDNPEKSRPYFRRLRQLRGFFQMHFPQVDWKDLSMGMSNDYEVAVEEGATWVRIGQAILGPRHS
jgi:hypothetical protein